MARDWEAITAHYRANDNPETMLIVDALTELVVRRVELGMTQAQVAEKAGVPQSTIARIESLNKGLPSLKSLVRYADAVGVDLALTLTPREN
jgi:transcriptional regulator with XRE-family HTH domain